MRFLVDANLPPRLVPLVRSRGHEADHVSALDLGQSATDSAIARWADDHGAVVVSKDDDFRLLQVATGRPRKLLLVATGNISNRHLVSVMESRVDAIATALLHANCVEVRRDSLTVFDASPAD